MKLCQSYCDGCSEVADPQEVGSFNELLPGSCREIWYAPIVMDDGEVIGGIGVGGAHGGVDDRVGAEALKSIAALLA